MEPRVSVHHLDRLSPEARARLCTRTEGDLSSFIPRVRTIIEAVRSQGDQALVRFAQELDQSRVEAEDLKVRPEEFDQAQAGLEPEVAEALGFAAANIRGFHQQQLPEPMWLTETRPGVFCGERLRPIPSVACYVPRGKGSFPSVLLMTVIPAVVAGVPRIAILTPPGPDGSVDPASLVAARLAGVEEVYRCGGAQAVAAAAYGTQTLPRVDKIVGPGSPWVVAAKRLLADRIDPGPPAGPSEAIVLADRTAEPHTVGLDLVIESEHGPDSSAFLVTPDQDLARAVQEALPRVWEQMGTLRQGFSQAVLCGPMGGIVLARDMDQALAFVNDYGPEHLLVHSQEPFAYLHRIENAGEILLGQHTPLTIGNYCLGPNAVLPTSGAARTHSPLSVHDFVKRTSLGYVTSGAYEELAARAGRLASYEGFDGHSLAVSALRHKPQV